MLCSLFGMEKPTRDKSWRDKNDACCHHCSTLMKYQWERKERDISESVEREKDKCFGNNNRICIKKFNSWGRGIWILNIFVENTTKYQLSNEALGLPYVTLSNILHHSIFFLLVTNFNKSTVGLHFLIMSLCLQISRWSKINNYFIY